MFYGVGGAKRISERRWTIPAGIQQNHFVTTFAEIEGSMIGLMSRFELSRLGYKWHAMEDTCSFSQLGVDWLPFTKASGSLLLDIFEFNVNPGEDELFSRFVVTASSAHLASTAALATEDAYTTTQMFECLQEDCLYGNGVGEMKNKMLALPGKMRRRIVRTVQK